jgi:hypothetical protein
VTGSLLMGGMALPEIFDPVFCFLVFFPPPKSYHIEDKYVCCMLLHCRWYFGMQNLKGVQDTDIIKKSRDGSRPEELLSIREQPL